jgi:hypothetical protein
MEPAYRNIEFCSRPNAAWAKLKSGRYDWLGLRSDGDFVLGTPPRKHIEGFGAATSIKAGAVEGRHGVRAITEPRHEDLVSRDWYASADEARVAFEALIADWERRDGPMLARLELVQDDRLADEAFVVNLTPTYGVWRPPPGV